MPATAQRPAPHNAVRADELGLSARGRASPQRPPAEPAPATKHLTIEIDHKVPQLLWQDTLARMNTQAGKQGAST
jgi:hypothetical protein